MNTSYLPGHHEYKLFALATKFIYYCNLSLILNTAKVERLRTHHAAPTTDRDIASPMPRDPHINGEVLSKNLT